MLYILVIVLFDSPKYELFELLFCSLLFISCVLILAVIRLWESKQKFFASYIAQWVVLRLKIFREVWRKITFDMSCIPFFNSIIVLILIVFHSILISYLQWTFVGLRAICLDRVSVEALFRQRCIVLKSFVVSSVRCLLCTFCLRRIVLSQFWTCSTMLFLFTVFLFNQRWQFTRFCLFLRILFFCFDSFYLLVFRLNGHKLFFLSSCNFRYLRGRINFRSLCKPCHLRPLSFILHWLYHQHGLLI